MLSHSLPNGHLSDNENGALAVTLAQRNGVCESPCDGYELEDGERV
jgi:hypothetical protein